MAETKVYEEGAFRFEFAPQGDPYRGDLVTTHPEMPPYAADVDLSKKRSRGEYANDAAETWGAGEGPESAKDLKKALNALYVRLREEVAATEAERETDAQVAHPEVGQEEIDALVGRPGVLDRLVEDAAACSGVVRERRMLGLICLAACSAQLELMPNDKPMAASLMLTAASGRGKNHLFDAVARVLPESFYFAFESSSAKSFYYAAENNPAVLKHRWVYPNEAEATDQVVELLRPLLSGGRARHSTVNKDARGRLVWREYTLEGPVVLTIATVRNKIDAQLQTRMLVAGLEDYEGRVRAHSGAVSGQIAIDYAGSDRGREILAWRAALDSLAGGIRRVVTPVRHDGFRFDRDDVSHGARLWTGFLGLMCAHAWLEQRSRGIIDLPDGEESIVAAPEDYEAAYEIFEATCERSVVNLSDAHRKILDAVYEMQEEDDEESYSFDGDHSDRGYSDRGFPQRKIAGRASVPQSTISDNKTFLVKSAKLLWEPAGGGLALVNDADPSWWEKGDVLAGLPRPQQVRAWWSSGDEPSALDTPGRAGHAHEATEKHDGTEENGDRGSFGRRPEASGHLARDEAGHHDDRPDDRDDRHGPGRENALDERESAPEEGPTGATDGFGDRYEPEEEIDGCMGSEVEEPEGPREDDDRARDEDPWDGWD